MNHRRFRNNGSCLLLHRCSLLIDLIYCLQLLRLLELHGGKIKERNEKVKMTLIKDAGCKTQAVCGASVLKCKGCGAPISLMEGKTCRFCGSTLDLKKYDWVIERYGTV